ncbi:unnamed protein product [Candida verbasci]|uniref:Minichromosome loss protein Mcl1 middle region domain-containing protein n=1 Tax=Candida verbasci TaxID=1227364 RepID=A0A9W4TVS1_9ASCO|nr:unnamed protein product [Candida verbasci]
MPHRKITAFPDGNSFVYYNESLDKLLIGNSEGLIKVFNVHDTEQDPTSIDILENLTSLSLSSNNVVLTTTEGHVELIDLKDNVSKGTIFRSELPLRAVEFINQGNRIICGGDDNKLIIVDLQDSNSVKDIDIPDQVVNISYSSKGETVSISLSNGNVQVYSVVNEEINLVQTLTSVIPRKINCSMDKVDYNNENHDELITCTKSQWSADGNYLLIPIDNTIKVFERSSWKEVEKRFKIDEKIIDFIIKDQYLLVLTLNVFKVFDFKTGKSIHEDDFEFDEDSLPINLSFYKNNLFLGSTNGETIHIKKLLEEQEENGELNDLFVNDVDVSDDEELKESDVEEPAKRKYYLHEEDDLIIDEEDLPDFKRPKHSPINTPSKIIPYSPGSAPFQNDRRYLTMNNHGYAWIVQNKENKSITITVSFFDRSLNNEYHFTEYHEFDLASINQKGILLGESSTGLLYYRPHNESTNESWEKKIPLLDDEYITGICVTDSDTDNNDVVVGTNFGYLRFFNQYGISLNVIKTMPITTLVASAVSHIFIIHQTSNSIFNFSIVDTDQDYKFYQQHVHLPLIEHPQLIKGIFFNEYNDPCIVTGHDDTLLILHAWRESNNAKWIPILNCKKVITDYGAENKKNWNCWPLGLLDDKLNCLILKNSQYPGFPLPLPIELNIEIPIKHNRDDNVNEEIHVRSTTMGRILANTLNEGVSKSNEDEIMTKLENYQRELDRSLVKLFADSCGENNLSKAMSIAKMIRNDKALMAVSKVAERFDFLSLAAKVGQLRENLLELDD